MSCASLVLVMAVLIAGMESGQIDFYDNGIDEPAISVNGNSVD